MITLASANGKRSLPGERNLYFLEERATLENTQHDRNLEVGSSLISCLVKKRRTWSRIKESFLQHASIRDMNVFVYYAMTWSMVGTFLTIA